MKHCLYGEFGFNKIDLRNGVNDHSQTHGSPGKDDAQGQEKKLAFVHTRDIYVERIEGKRIILDETCNNDT